MSKVRTRMAPSPTGEFHIGGMRTLLYNYALAKKEGGKFILRIEDTDRERLVEGATERLLQVIKDYGLSWDEGPENGGPHAPYIQSDRLDFYKKYAQELIDKGHAYYCFCTKERLDQLRETQRKKGNPTTKYDKHCLNLPKKDIQEKLTSGTPYVIRLNIQPNEEVSFDDKVLGHITFPTSDLDDQVLLKSDGFPTYHLAVVVDDNLMGINIVMRGMEWLPSTPKHILLYKAFNWKLPAYAHLPLLKELGDTRKLSKRMGSVSAVEFLKEGYLPNALLNFLMFLGWNPGTEKEIYSLNEFINDFSIEKIHKTDLVVFDREKLLWFNGYYIRNTASENLWDLLVKWGAKFEVELPGFNSDKEYSLKVLDLVKERMKLLSEYNSLTHYFYSDPEINPEILYKYTENKNQFAEILNGFLNLYENCDKKNWNLENINKISHEFVEKNNIKPKEAFMTLRAAVTGEIATPPIMDIVYLLGQNTVINRLKNALK